MVATPPKGTLFPPPPPPGLNYTAVVQPSIIFLMIGTVFSGILIPLLVALFHFSTKNVRRKPIFILNVVSIMLGLVLGIYNAYNEITAMISPLTPLWRYYELMFSLMVTFIPCLVEVILLLRLLAVYPYAHTRKRIWFAIFIPLILLKLARIINTSIFNVNSGRSHPSSSESPQRVWDRNPSIKIEWILQVIDNTATSILFIMRLQGRLNAPERKESRSSGNSYTSQLKSLFWIAVSNFVFPVIFTIIQLILFFHDPSYLKASYIYIVNTYVEIIGVLLATVWTTSQYWTDQNTSSATTSIKTAPRFASNSRLRNQIFTGCDTTQYGIGGENDEAEHRDLQSPPNFGIQEKGRSPSG